MKTITIELVACSRGKSYDAEVLVRIDVFMETQRSVQKLVSVGHSSRAKAMTSAEDFVNEAVSAIMNLNDAKE